MSVQLLCFQHLSESHFLLGALHRRSKFANFCHNLMQTLCTYSFILVNILLLFNVLLLHVIQSNLQMHMHNAISSEIQYNIERNLYQS